ncbi:MAG: signal peptidase I [Gammaproteobacteria bacterium]|nr:signal peptidase I [Gammaproteobacteria bacterium]MDD9799941.1 signal peptidase I [Gammaproteobacteria bacterium]MDD9870046.1 signal peptidase I [Gammaproteobacteria bacterium]
MTFSLVLLCALVASGVIILAYRIFAPPPKPRASSVASPEAAAAAAARPPAPEPKLLEYARLLFPVILVVLLLRSFVVEPFRIPSGSMLPSLHIGDFILVSKFSYGLRLPIINTKIADTGAPRRGDVMVFRFPRDQNVNYIKRVVGLPGDEVRYAGKTVYINGRQAERTEAGGDRNFRFYVEKLDDAGHQIQIDPGHPGPPQNLRVPAGHYFVMGDNRDNSHDSRVWGFVPESHLVGRAFLIWFSWNSAAGGGVNWSRIGGSIL